MSVLYSTRNRDVVTFSTCEHFFKLLEYFTVIKQFYYENVYYKFDYWRGGGWKFGTPLYVFNGVVAHKLVHNIKHFYDVIGNIALSTNWLPLPQCQLAYRMMVSCKTEAAEKAFPTHCGCPPCSNETSAYIKIVYTADLCL